MTYPEFKARYALTPDPQQEAAILRAEGPTLLLAVPGSGKTTTLVTRLGYLIHCLGVEPGRILTVTYTVAAAGDMKRRFAALFGEEHAGALAFPLRANAPCPLRSFAPGIWSPCIPANASPWTARWPKARRMSTRACSAGNRSPSASRRVRRCSPER